MRLAINYNTDIVARSAFIHSRMTLYRATTAIIDFIITLVAALLGLRIVLKLFGANETNGVVQAMYAISQPLIAPFVGIFPSLELEQGYVLEFATVFALVLYAVLAHILTTLVRAIAYSSFRRRHALRTQG